MSPSVVDGTLNTGSDYGSDIELDDDAQLCEVLEEIELRHRAHPPLVIESLEEHVTAGYAIVPCGSQPRQELVDQDREEEQWTIQLDDESLCIDLATVSQQSLFPSQRRPRETSASPDENIPDTRTPLERFRTLPKKPLSVTDLVSPAWCELQYWYTLTKFGRKKSTPAMKQGSSVHKKLEEEVHTTVKVDIESREDAWGLKIWNVIQGLRTLRAAGMTRELEIWGVLDGQIVNGIIDELSFTCNDLVLEAKLSAEAEKKSPQLDPNQATISQFFGNSIIGGTMRSKPRPEDVRQVYLTDIKTRGSATVPTGASLRPTIMQLMLYRKILSDLANNAVNAEQVFARYSLKPDDAFSDSLVAQLASLDFTSSQDSTASGDTVTELLTHNSLRQLWQLMIQQFQTTFPHGATSISPILRADFRNARDGSVIGAKSFLHDETKLQAYIADEMSWWKGKREARGVDVEEAFKCRSCQFADTCTWRNTKIEEAVQKSRARSSAQVKTAG